MASPTPAAPAAPPLPRAEELLAGTWLQPLLAHRDARGVVAELYRAEWAERGPAVQWTMILSDAGVLRGVHVHALHTDYLTVLVGCASLRLRDLRPGSPTAGRIARVDLREEEPSRLIIPPGVAHGLYFARRTAFVLGLDRPYDSDDEIGCHWRDPDLGFDWPVVEPRLSERDAALPPLRALTGRIPPWGG